MVRYRTRTNEKVFPLPHIPHGATSVVTDIVKKHDKSICSGAQSVTLQQYFSHPGLVIYFFPTPPIKLKLELQLSGRLSTKSKSETGGNNQIITNPITQMFLIFKFFVACTSHSLRN
jgi:hypothetical protein